MKIAGNYIIVHISDGKTMIVPVGERLYLQDAEIDEMYIEPYLAANVELAKAYCKDVLGMDDWSIRRISTVRE